MVTRVANTVGQGKVSRGEGVEDAYVARAAAEHGGGGKRRDQVKGREFRRA